MSEKKEKRRNVIIIWKFDRSLFRDKSQKRQRNPERNQSHKWSRVVCLYGIKFDRCPSRETKAESDKETPKGIRAISDQEFLSVYVELNLTNVPWKRDKSRKWQRNLERNQSHKWSNQEFLSVYVELNLTEASRETKAKSDKETPKGIRARVLIKN